MKEGRMLHNGRKGMRWKENYKKYTSLRKSSGKGEGVLTGY
jgi:hypothetical protein